MVKPSDADTSTELVTDSFNRQCVYQGKETPTDVNWYVPPAIEALFLGVSLNNDTWLNDHHIIINLNLITAAFLR